MSIPNNRDIIKKLDNKTKSRQDDITVFKNDIDKVKQLDSSNIDKAETKLKIFLMLKADCRVLLTALYDSTNELKGILNIEQINNELSDFETKYEFFETLKSNEQIQRLSELLDIRDSLISRLANELISHTEMMYLRQYHNDGIILDLCSYSIPVLLSLFSTYKYINSQMKIVELHKGSAAIEQISILQGTIDNLKEIIKNTETERDQSNEKFQVLTDSVAGRYLKAVEMQDKIIQLENDKIQLQDGVIEKDIENRKLKQIIGQMQDSLTVIRSQLYESKDAYSRDIVKFQPILEQHYYKAIEEEKQLQSLRSDANIGFERAKVAEKQKQQIELENNKIRNEMKITKTDISLKEKMMNQVLQENERLKQINICLTAAKIKSHELAKSNELKLLDEKRKIKEYDSKMDDTHEEMKEMEQYILQLQQLVENAESSEREANDKLALFIAEKEGDALFLNEALSRLEKVEEAGLSESKQREFDNMAKKINELENDKKNLNEQLNNAMRKIYDLQLSKTS